MKKFVYFLMAFALLLGACKGNKEEQMFQTTVEQTVQADYTYMSENYDSTFVWFESSITLKNYIDDENCDGSFVTVRNIFQTTVPDTADINTRVIFILHDGELINTEEVVGFWTEDLVINPADITLTYEQAYERLMQADIVKPHSKYCVLRKPLGPFECNAQYIFGNANSTLIFVDAVTGDVSDTDPAFNKRE